MKTYQKLWWLLAYRPWLTVAALATWMLIAFVPVGLGLVARAFFNALSGGAPAGAGLWWLVVLPVVVQSGRLAVTWVTVPLTVLQRFTISALLSRNLFAHILGRPGAAALDRSVGEAMICFRDDAEEVARFTSLIELLSVLGEVVAVVVTLVLMLRISVPVTVVPVLSLLGITLIARAAAKRLGEYRSRSRAATGKVTGALGEMLGMVQAVKLAGAEAAVTDHLRLLSDRRRQETVRDALFGELLRSIFLNTGNLGIGLVLLMAAGTMGSERFTVGDFALFASYVGRVGGFAGILGDLLARYRQVAVSLDRMGALMVGAPAGALVTHAPIHLQGPLPELPQPARQSRDRLTCLDARNLTCLHPQSGRGIRGVSLKVTRGSFTVITGRVGSGKTTLLRALQGLLPLQYGEISWNGEAVTDPGRHFQPPRSSYTPQIPALFSATLRENLLMGLPDHQSDLNSAIWSAVLEGDVSRLDQGLDTPVGPRGVKLSGGQVQRVAAARMHVRDPELLIFDDLSSALDVETEQILWQRLRARPNTTCLAVSHREAVLRAADQIILLCDGRLEATGTWSQLMAESDEFIRLQSHA